MIRYLYGSELDRHSALAAAMFRDRAAQFRDRMGWEVTVDDLGWETDGYDALDPIYVIVEDGAGGHAASMRFLPTTGSTMLADVFPHLMGGAAIRSPRVWECTRFCLSPGADAGVARRLLLGAVELGLSMGVSHSVGVFDTPMTRIYRRLGWSPEVLGSEGGISAGIWELDEDVHDHLCRTSGVDAATSRRWLEDCFGDVLASRPLPVGA
ncbi:MAG: acyl-homoserine-lactone synthase [Jannaschia sp.]